MRTLGLVLFWLGTAVSVDVLDATVRRGLEDLRAETRDGLAENRRHTEVLFDSLRDDIQILAEGFAMVSLKLDSLQR